MTRLWITPETITNLIAASKAAIPEEICGLLVGRDERVDEVIRITNVAPDPTRHYRLHDEQFIQAIFDIQRRGKSLLAFFHSHPSGDPIPSGDDIRLATYPDTPYLIIGHRNAHTQVAAWLMLPGQVKRITIHVGFQPPPMSTQQLSTAQKTAIFAAAGLAFAFLIVLALSLLPPAPIIINQLP